MKKAKQAFAFLIAILLSHLSSLPAQALAGTSGPAQNVQQWYLEYMQQYSSMPTYNQSTNLLPVAPGQSVPTQPSQPVQPMKPTQPRPSSTPAPTGSQLPTNFTASNYIKYLQQYKATTSMLVKANQPATAPLEGTNPPVDPQSRPANPPTVPTPTGLTAEEKQVFELVNQERAAAGVNPVAINEAIVNLARMKAREIAELDYYGHISPTYGSPGQMLSQAGVNCRQYGENICKAADVYRAHMLLMNSTAHKQIMLDPTYSQVGIGVAYYKDKPGLVVVELFIQP
ncbi:MAG: hypothetical protein HPY81_03030 [Firmicutes bacterium]|nr:hypothetical protein [Bacillota bacterium]